MGRRKSVMEFSEHWQDLLRFPWNNFALTVRGSDRPPACHSTPAGGAVGDVDGAGVREAGAFQAAAHGVVILMGVRPQMGTPRPRPGHGLGQHAGMGTVAAQAVEGAV